MVQIKRIIEDIDKLSLFTDSCERGRFRFSYTENYNDARNYLENEMKKIGMETWVDNIGNLHGKLKGDSNTGKVLLSGSHIDTVMNGGKYDGILGVVCAIEVARCIVENNLEIKHDYEVIIFVEEEGASFALGLLGSMAATGKINTEKSKELKNSNGETLYDVLKTQNLNPEKLSEVEFDFENIIGIIELHIEQGSVLDIEKKPIGLVKAIVGMRWYEIVIQGVTNHAGATPMRYRKDPMLEASKIILELPELVKSYGNDSTVITVGKVEVFPNQANVIPDRVKFIIDLRGTDSSTFDRIKAEVKKRLDVIKENGYNCSIETQVSTNEITSSEKILNVMREVVQEENINAMEMYSGANHDCTKMGEKCEVAMIFVPSVNGRSHCPEEFTEEKDIEEGCNLLLKTIYKILK